MTTSTVLFKNKRYKISDLKNMTIKKLLKHFYRSYNDRTMKQRKYDFNKEQTKNNLIFDSDLETFQVVGENWEDTIKADTNDFFKSLESELNEIHSYFENMNNDTLNEKEREKIRYSIKYISKLKLNEKDNENEVIKDIFLKLADQCNEIINQKETEKDYSLIDKNLLNELNDYYLNIDKNTKIKSLNAKKKHLNLLIKDIDKMSLSRVFDETTQENSVFIEERLFKIPKHNNKTVEPEHVAEIMRTWHQAHFKPFNVIKGFYHKDERSSGTENAVDDHLHLLINGFNQDSKRFDLPDYTFKLSQELAKKHNIKFDCKSKSWNTADEEEQVRSGEVIQEVFYKHANEILKKHNYDFTFKINEKTEDELIKREIIKKFAHLPKSQRPFSMLTYIEEQNNAKIKEIKKQHQIDLENEKVKYDNKLRNEKSNILKEYKQKVFNEKKQEKKSFDKKINEIKEKGRNEVFKLQTEKATLEQENKKLKQLNEKIKIENKNMSKIFKKMAFIFKDGFINDIFKSSLMIFEISDKKIKEHIEKEYFKIVDFFDEVNQINKFNNENEKEQIPLISKSKNIVKNKYNKNEFVFDEDDLKIIEKSKNDGNNSFIFKSMKFIKNIFFENEEDNKINKKSDLKNKVDIKKGNK